MKMKVIAPLWKKRPARLNRSRHWAEAKTYKQAREQAFAANAEIKHKTVR